MERPHLFSLGDNNKIAQLHSVNLNLLMNYWASFTIYMIITSLKCIHQYELVLMGLLFFVCYLSNNWFISDHGIYENSELENNMSAKETKDDSKAEIKEPASTEEKTNEPSTTQVCIIISLGPECENICLKHEFPQTPEC